MKGQTDQHNETVAFTYDWYCDFLDRVRAEGYEFTTFDGSVEAGEVLLRHDVDLSLEAAIEMARLEANRGVRATYCIMLSSSLYNPMESRWREALHTIDALGHDIGLHFSTHEYWRGRSKPEGTTVARRVGIERSILDAIAPSLSDAVSFHIPPDWVLDRSFDGFQSTYAPDVFGEISYVADSGCRWRSEPPAVSEFPDRVQILTHPGLWGETDYAFDRRVKQRVVEANSHANRKAREEFLDAE